MTHRAGTTGADKVHGPAVETHAVDKIILALGRLAEMLCRGIIRIGDRTVGTAAIDGMLAPYDGMSHMYILFFGKIPEVVGRKESAHDAFRFVAVAHELANLRYGLAHLAVDAFAWQIHGREITGKVADFIAVTIVALARILPDLAVILALVLESVEGETPCETTCRISFGKSLADVAHALQSMPFSFVARVELDIAGYFPWSRAYHQTERQKAVAVQGQGFGLRLSGSNEQCR